MRRLLCAAAMLVASAPARAEGPRLRVIDGTGDGHELWQSMIRKQQERKPLTDHERNWASLIRSRIEQWDLEIDTLAKTFHPVDGPELARIVIGNHGGEDAFTHDAKTIGFDVSRLYGEYGDALLDENTARIDRFFRHEYVHLLQKEWLARWPYDAGTPLREALLDIWTEGLGNYYSLSEKWRSTGGAQSDTAQRTLVVLTPRFIARLAALACASNDHAAPLLEDLSFGRFDQKWGALPAALWLESETSHSGDALRDFVVNGPDGIWTFAQRHISDESRAVLDEARKAAALCRAAARVSR